ncbi:MAG: DUF4159 domain-containing protein [Flavobacteriaceae bacterium]|nr:DUF4159 domain-containing protein [Flavobacteriaceae bacterium]
MKIFLLALSFVFSVNISSQKVARLKYQGGGDWYSNPTALPNLIGFCNKNINTFIDKNIDIVDVKSENIFKYAIIFATGHGNVYMDDQDVSNLRKYLVSGGFLHVSDNYGLDVYIRREMKKVFPDLEFVELPSTHNIFKKPFLFVEGMPKIHEHDDKQPKAYGLFYKNRLVCFYDYESDLSDGWEDVNIHNDSVETRLKALKMGANIVNYVFEN